MINPRKRVLQLRKQVQRKFQKTATNVRKTVNRARSTLLKATTSNVNRTALLHAVRYAHDQWRMQAKLQDIRIMAISAIGTPGCLQGPDLEPLICRAPTVVAQLGPLKDLRDAVAEGVDECFDKWQNNVTVPGLPWYPAFAAWPGPSAPPMPNVPFPLITLASSGAAKITSATQLKQAMLDALPPVLKTAEMDDFLTDLSVRLSSYFIRWLAAQLVMNVLGKGPVPTFAPPYVPVGPVVMGDIISTPGSLYNGALPMIM